MRARLLPLRLPRLFPARRPRRAAAPRAVRGLVRNVIVVKPPDPRFREALFILRDDYLLNPDREQEELLREARAAALASCPETAPPRRPRRYPFWLLPLLAALAALGCRAAGLI